MRPEQILSDEDNSRKLSNGATIRKGSIAAFMVNIDIIDREPETSEAYREALNDLISLIPAMEGIGVFNHFSLKSAKAGKIIEEYYIKNKSNFDD